jgi:hypothetical protein
MCNLHFSPVHGETALGASDEPNAALSPGNCRPDDDAQSMARPDAARIHGAPEILRS